MTKSFLLRFGAVLVAAYLLAACSSGSQPANICCTPAPFSLGLNATMTSAPVPSSTTSIVFSSNATVAGVPHLTGSDGSSLSGGNLTGQCLLPSGSSTPACGWTSAISGLAPHTTYTVSFTDLLITPVGATTPTDYGPYAAGSFQTQ
jgi:hypothetical protein